MDFEFNVVIILLPLFSCNKLFFDCSNPDFDGLEVAIPGIFCLFLAAVYFNWNGLS